MEAPSWSSMGLKVEFHRYFGGLHPPEKLTAGDTKQKMTPYILNERIIAFGKKSSFWISQIVRFWGVYLSVKFSNTLPDYPPTNDHMSNLQLGT